MSTLNATATTNSDALLSTSATYANARDGTGATPTLMGGNDSRTGQRLTGGFYQIFETFLEFDCTSIPVGATVSAATLTLYLRFDDSTQNFITQARVYDYGVAITAGDWVPGGSLSGNTLVATLDSATCSAGADNAFTDVALAANIILNGMTRLVLSSDREVSNTAPGASDEYLTFYSYDATHPAKLDVTYTVPSSTVDPIGMMGFFGA